MMLFNNMRINLSYGKKTFKGFNYFTVVNHQVFTDGKLFKLRVHEA